LAHEQVRGKLLGSEDVLDDGQLSDQTVIEATMISIPSDVSAFIGKIFADCNVRISTKLTNIPNVHETSLDETFVEHFTHYCRPVITPSDWTIRVDCHYIGGGRQHKRWEIADVGILVVFRHKGVLIRTKVALFQSKRLFTVEDCEIQSNPIGHDLGLNYLFHGDDLWEELSKPRMFSFENSSAYNSLVVGEGQYSAIEDYENEYDVPVNYLLYNPLQIPFSTAFPIIDMVGMANVDCKVGCRVIPSKVLRQMLDARSIKKPPTYEEVSKKLSREFTEGDQIGGWRLESYINDQLLTCKDGLIDNDKKEGKIHWMFAAKSRPISAAIVITLDMPTIPLGF
jgi:hypothetical protein